MDLHLLKSTLPETWSAPEIVEDAVVADSLTLFRAGVAAVSPSGDEAIGSAAAFGGSPLRRSCYELLERASILEAIGAARPALVATDRDRIPLREAAAAEVFPLDPDPSRWRHARSNGVALHDSWGGACTRAAWELVERHRILRAWYGHTTPRPLELARDGTPLLSAPSYALSAYEFPASDDGAWDAGVRVTGVFGFPRRAGLPLIAGYGAEQDLKHAVEHALAEAAQLLAFLWGDPIPDAPPRLAPRSQYHLDHYLFADNHRILEEWLAGAHRTYATDFAVADERGDIAFVDLTPGWMPEGLFVAKAVCPAALPLAFGDAPYAHHLPAHVRVHPIA